MKYNKVLEAMFISRPNRFIAEVLINGKEETVHVKNTGRCKELLQPGAKVILEDCSHVLTRKTKYSIIAVWKNDMIINIDSHVPNKVVFDALNDNKIEGLEDLDFLKREVTFGNSRFDIYFEDGDKKGFIEVKGVTLEHYGVSMFPDAPTERGSKHVLEMIKAVKQGYRGIIFFLIQLNGSKQFRLNWKMDEKFAETIKLANENGVEIIAYDSIVGEDNISINRRIEINLAIK